MQTPWIYLRFHNSIGGIWVEYRDWRGVRITPPASRKFNEKKWEVVKAPEGKVTFFISKEWKSMISKIQNQSRGEILTIFLYSVKPTEYYLGTWGEVLLDGTGFDKEVVQFIVIGNVQWRKTTTFKFALSSRCN